MPSISIAPPATTSCLRHGAVAAETASPSASEHYGSVRALATSSWMLAVYRTSKVQESAVVKAGPAITGVNLSQIGTFRPHRRLLFARQLRRVWRNKGVRRRSCARSPPVQAVPGISGSEIPPWRQPAVVAENTVACHGTRSEVWFHRFKSGTPADHDCAQGYRPRHTAWTGK